MDERYIVELRGISKVFPGVNALTGIDLRIKAGTVHAIVGENGAGKSTLMNILNGQLQPDEGEIFIDGQPVVLSSPRDAARLGIAMLHQELSVVPLMTVADNVYLNREPRNRAGLISKRAMRAGTEELLQKGGIHVPPNALMGSLTISEQQLIEIEKILTSQAKIIIMDEPTSSISKHETEVLLKKINSLKAQGMTVIYISHRLEELKVVADEITVIRDGFVIGTVGVNDVTNDQIIEMMVGRKLDNVYPEHAPKLGDVIFEVKDLCGEKFSNVSFQARAGEILGIAGLVGAGRTEMAQAIFGLAPVYSGQILVNGREYTARSPAAAVRQGVALVPEDRRIEGLVLCRDIKENVTLPNLKKYAPHILINGRREREDVQKHADELQIKANSIRVRTETLSGGNQQKVVIAKWLMSEPAVMIVDEPTRGIDVGAKYEIYSLLCSMAAAGKAIVMISSDLPELLGVCDRIVVMSSGTVTGDVPRGEATQELIMSYATENIGE